VILVEGSDRVVKPDAMVWLVGHMDWRGQPVYATTSSRVLASARRPGELVEIGGKTYQTTCAGTFGAVVWPLTG
jgi:hypothetical protein